jgi:CheY-like chemotaxis protein
MIHRLIGRDIELLIIKDPEIAFIRADQGQVEQVIMNLIINARDAMENHGTITIKTAGRAVTEEYCRFHPDAHPGKFVCLSVKDTGQGMDSKIQSHIFEPFFTTKVRGEGTGLGLSTAYGIVKQHRGWITVESEPGTGSKFEIFFPAYEGGESRKSEPSQKTTNLKGDGERILVIEDEDDILEFVKRALGMNDYVVFPSKNAKEALEVFEKEKGHFDLILCDVILPDKSGIQLADQLNSHNPDIPIILNSGLSIQKPLMDTIRRRSINFLQKPYRLNDLLLAIKEALKDKMA